MDIGFIGCGNIAHFHADALKALDVSIVAVTARENSPNIIPFSEKYNIKHQYTQWEAMVEKEALDALWVVASWDQMDQLLLPLIKSGIPLLLEKPVALTSAKIQEAIDLHVGTKQYIQVGYNRRFYPFIDEIKSIIENGELRSVFVEIPESVDLKNINFADNLWVINSSHLIDLLVYFVGPLDIKYKDQKILSGSEIPSSFNAMLETENNVPVHLIAEWNTSNNFGITFFVDKKSIILKPLEKALIHEGFDVIEPAETIPVRQYKPKLIGSFCSEGKFKPGFYEQTEYFIDNYKLSGRISKHADLHQCLSTTSLIEKIMGR